jgi:hypothetical protein
MSFVARWLLGSYASKNVVSLCENVVSVSKNVVSCSGVVR